MKPTTGFGFVYENIRLVFSFQMYAIFGHGHTFAPTVFLTCHANTCVEHKTLAYKNRPGQSIIIRHDILKEHMILALPPTRGNRWSTFLS